jgi:hypothetical protein
MRPKDAVASVQRKRAQRLFLYKRLFTWIRHVHHAFLVLILALDSLSHMVRFQKTPDIWYTFQYYMQNRLRA